MKKTMKKAHGFLVFLLTVGIIVLRTVQLNLYTDEATGYIKKGAEGTAAVFYCLVLLLAVVVLVCFYGKEYKAGANPFEKNSKPLCVTAVLAGASMFADFIIRVVFAYNYVSNVSSVEYNYLIPLCLSAFVSLLCAFYFIVMGVSFKTDKYNFLELKYFHLILPAAPLCALVTCLTENVDVTYAEEQLLNYVVLTAFIVFGILFIKAVDDNGKNIQSLGVFSLLYAVLAVIAFVPRIIAFAFGVSFSYATFSTVAYFFTGIFALTLGINIFRQKKD